MKEQTKNLTENKDTLKKIMDQFEKQKGKSKNQIICTNIRININESTSMSQTNSLQK